MHVLARLTSGKTHTQDFQRPTCSWLTSELRPTCAYTELRQNSRCAVTCSHNYCKDLDPVPGYGDIIHVLCLSVSRDYLICYVMHLVDTIYCSVELLYIWIKEALTDSSALLTIIDATVMLPSSGQWSGKLFLC